MPLEIGKCHIVLIGQRLDEKKARRNGDKILEELRLKPRGDIATRRLSEPEIENILISIRRRSDSTQSEAMSQWRFSRYGTNRISNCLLLREIIDLAGRQINDALNVEDFALFLSSKQLHVLSLGTLNGFLS